jgi:hypothetical protein
MKKLYLGFIASVMLSLFYNNVSAQCNLGTAVFNVTLPYTGTGLTTCGSGNNLTSTNLSVCGSTLYDGGEDNVYIFTPTFTGTTTISLTSSSSWIGIKLYQGCPTSGGTCVANASSSAGNQTLSNVAVQSGVTYYLQVDTWPTPDCIPSFNLNITAPPAVDIKLDALVSPIPNQCYSANQEVSVRVSNAGLDTLFFDVNELTLNVNVTGINPQTLSTLINTGFLAPGQNEVFVVESNYDMSAIGLYTFASSLTMIGDLVATNNTIPSVAITTDAAFATPLEVDFAGFTGTNLATVFPGWRESVGANPTGTTSAWTVGNPAQNTHFNYFLPTAKVDMQGNNRREWIISPKIVVGATDLLAYKIAVTGNNTGTAAAMGIDDSLYVMISTDCRQTWSQLAKFGRNDNLSNYLTQYQHSLAAYAGQEVVLGFYAYSGFIQDAPTYDIHLDDINIGSSLSSKDAGVVGFTNITSCGLSAAESITIKVQNAGNAPINNFDVAYSINSGADVIETITTTINPGEVFNYTFTTTADLSISGTYAFRAYSELGNDTDSANDTIRFNITNVELVDAFPYLQDFENGAAGWTARSLNTTALTWALGTPAQAALNSAYSGTNAWMTGLSANYPNNANEVVQSPCMDMSTLINPYFSVYLRFVSENNWDGLILEASNDGGNSWTKVGTSPSFYNNTSTFGPITPPKWSGNNSAWTKYTVAIPQYAGESQVFFRFRFGSDGSGIEQGFAFDDVYIFDSLFTDLAISNLQLPSAPACGLGNEEISVTITNNGSTAEDNFVVGLIVNGGTPTLDVFGGQILPGETVDFTLPTLANLSALGNYDIRAFIIVANDLNNDNDTTLISSIINYEVPANPIVSQAVVDCSPAIANVEVSNPAIFTNWYSDMNATDLVGTGASFTTPLLVSSTTYYVENVNGLDQRAGKLNFGATFNLEANAGLLFDANSEFVLDSVYIRGNNLGNVFIELRDKNNNLVYSYTHALTSTTAAQAVPLNFAIPVGTDHRLIVIPGTGTELVRETSIGFPFNVPGVLSVKNGISNGTPINTYFYFYDWRITVGGCASDLVPVDAQVILLENFLGNDTTICANQSLVLDAGAGYTYTWQDNSTNQTYTIPAGSSTFTYSVSITDGNCSGSDQILVTVDACTSVENKLASENNISIYPNPAKTHLNISFDRSFDSNTLLEIVDLKGKVAYSEEISSNTANIRTIDVNEFASGVYMIRIVNNELSITKKVIIQ